MIPIQTLPRLHVRAAGRLLGAAETRALSQVLVQQRLSLPTLCELTFAEPPGPLTPVEAWQPGTPLQLHVEAEPTALFSGQVTALEYLYRPDGERLIRVRAYDPLHQLRKRQRVQAYVQVSAYDLAQQLGGDVGLKLEAAESGPVWPRFYQHHQSDLELLVDIAGRSGLYLTVRGSTLHLLSLRGLGLPQPLRLGGSLLEARLEMNGDPACREVRATGWDPGLAQVHAGQAADARGGRAVGAAVLPKQVGGTGQRLLLDAAVGTGEQATALAQALLDQAVAREVTFWGIAEGDPRLQPGAPVAVAGVAPALSGRYILTEVTHTIDGQRGFLSELSTEPPVLPSRPQGALVTLGLVSAINDPLRAGRVKVTLPTYEDVETEWLNVVAAGAGAGKGLMVTPDRGDRVLVILSHEDPGRGLVLGGLYVDEVPDSGVEGGAVRRYSFRTPGGQLLTLDDQAQTLRLENSDGSYIRLAPEGVHLHAARDLEIEAPGRNIVIRGNTIDFQRG